MPAARMSIAAATGCLLVLACAAPAPQAEVAAGAESPYLLIYAGDEDENESNFLAVIDLRADSPDLGKAIATTPTGMTASMPHHMEYALPPAGEFLFVNALV